MGYSDKCHDLKTYWDMHSLTCVNCPRKPGYEITPNCGHDDYGGLHEIPATACRANTFNSGSRAYCQPCTSCPPGYDIASPCNSTTDTQCRDSRNWTTATNQGSTLTPNATTTFCPDPATSDAGLLWAVPLAVLLSTTLVLLSAFVIYRKRKTGQHTALRYTRRSSYVSVGFSPLSAATGDNELEGILSPDILSRPLQTVLDNLDVLEELIILLDPETHGVKNTKHLASHCSFPSAWITYTYSMKDSKSPLKAVLEGVTSRHPEWTVGHLAKMLKHMERIDTIAVLAKLRLNAIDV